MGRKIRAAQASLVATFLAAGGAATAKAMHSSSARPANTIGGSTSVNWGDQMVRFLKLDGFPAYLKYDGFAQLAMYYKAQLISDTETLYLKYGDKIGGVLELYQKADAGPLTGVLIGLEQYWKYDNSQALFDWLKTPGALDVYLKYEDFYSALQAVAKGDGENGSALDFYQKETGIMGVPRVQEPTDGGVTGGQ
jgi:hypothetical protein